MHSLSFTTRRLLAGAAFSLFVLPSFASAQTLVDPSLTVETVVSGLNQPIAMAFLGLNDFFVTEKASGKVKRVLNGVVSEVLDLAVNSSSERGLLGIALHPQFPANPGVYLFHTESISGTDTANVSDVPLLGHKVDRFVWNGSTLVFDQTVLRLRAFQEDLNLITDPSNPFNNPQPLQRGNHNGGVIRFGPDHKLYVINGDRGRRGVFQNNLQGPFPDDTFGGPLPDDAHATGTILRINDDGTIPTDNPFHALGTLVSSLLGTEIGENVQRVYAYGIRNSFGMTFDPQSHDDDDDDGEEGEGGGQHQALWTTENGGFAFDEINRIVPGFNGGWIQVMGPLSRIADYKAIEVGVGYGGGGPAGLQQLRWPATNIADDSVTAKHRMLDLPGSHYRDPEFSWKNVVPPAGLGFVGNGLGNQYRGNLIVGSAVFRPVAAPPSVMANPGNLYRFRLNGSRKHLRFNDPALQDKVADNLGRDDWVTEGSEILFGNDFGIVTDIQTGPDGQLYLVGTSSGTVRKIYKP